MTKTRIEDGRRRMFSDGATFGDIRLHEQPCKVMIMSPGAGFKGMANVKMLPKSTVVKADICGIGITLKLQVLR